MTIRKTATKQKLPGFLITLATAGVALVLFAAFMVFLLPVAAEGILENQLSKITGLTAQMSGINFSLTRPQFLIKELEFSNPQGFPEGLMSSIGEVRVRYSPPPPFGKWLDMKKVSIQFKEFRLLRNEKGDLNLPKVSPSPESQNVVEELVIDLNSLTYTDLSAGQPAQQTFDLGLVSAVYRNVKGVAGILEILNWEILKRTGIEEKKTFVIPEIKPIAESLIEDQTVPAQAPSAPPESEPSQSEPSPVPSAPAAG